MNRINTQSSDRPVGRCVCPAHSGKRIRLKPGLQRACCALLAAVVLFSASTASACPMCKAALANSDGGGDLVSGFFWSILFMMSMPFTILGSFSGYMYWQVRRARAAQAASADAPSAPPADSIEA